MQQSPVWPHLWTCRSRRPIKSSQSRFLDHLCDGGPAFWACVCYEQWVIGRRNGRFSKIYRCVHARRETIDGGTIRAAVNILNIQRPSSVPPTPLFVGVFPQFWAECVSDGPGIDFFQVIFENTSRLILTVFLQVNPRAVLVHHRGLLISLCTSSSFLFSPVSCVHSHSAYCFDYVHLCLIFCFFQKLIIYLISFLVPSFLSSQVRSLIKCLTRVTLSLLLFLLWLFSLSSLPAPHSHLSV